MNYKAMTVICLFCIAVLHPVFSAEWISLNGSEEGSEPVINVLESTDKHTLISISIPGFYVYDVLVEGRTYQKIVIPDTSSSTDIGSPEVPRIVSNVGIPDAAGVQIREVHRDQVTFGDYYLLPVQTPERDSDSSNEFVLNSDVYNGSESFPESGATITDPAIWRDIRLVTLHTFPVNTIPIDQTIEVAKEIVLELIYDDSATINIKTRSSFAVSRDYERMYKNSIINYEYMGFETRSQRDNSIKYLIIADDTLAASIQPLADWYIRSGLMTHIALTSETGSTTTEIKDVINSYYVNEGTQYVLLLGEITQIPVWNFGGDIGDYDYACLEGGDYYPEVALGRILTTSPDVVSHVIARIFNYVQNPPQDGWLEKTMLAAHEEQYPGKYTQCKNEILNYSYSIQNPIFDTYYPPEGATKAQVIAAMVEGRGIVNYRGHGDNQEWSWSLGWVNSDIYALNNGPKTPIVWNICCNNAWIDDSSETLSEAWQNAGSSGEGGAVANLGATRPSYTIENHDFDKRLYWAVYDEGVTRVGDVVNLGKETMVSMGTNGIFNSRIYIFFGDPAMDITTIDPMTFTVDHLPTVPIGGSDFTVTVNNMRAPVENALVCICKDDDQCYEVGYTNALGQVTLPATLMTGGDMLLTVTAHNFTPYTANVIVAAAGCGAMMMDKTKYNCDDDILIRVWDSDLNVNPGAPDTAFADISSDSEPVPETIVLTETGDDTSEFQGSIITSGTQGGTGYLLITHGDLITAVYADADCEGSPVDVIDTADADCLGPVISGVTVSGLSTDRVTISWSSDEVSDSVLTWGDTTPPSIVETDSAMELTHEFTLVGLDPCTQYYFMVSGTDVVGNETIDDNGGLYYSFVTLELVVLLEENMDADPGWVVEDLYAFGQPTGQGGEYGEPDPTSGYTGINVYGFNLNGDYYDNMPSTEYLTTYSFDCSSASDVFLNFWCWLGLEQNIYDEGYIDVSNNGGSTWSNVWTNSGSLDAGSWDLWELDISSIAAGYPDVVVRWGLGPTDVGWTWCGWNIDDVMISYSQPCGEVPTPTPGCLNHGDCTLDGEITASDAQMSFGIALGVVTPTTEEECAADCNGNGEVTAGDSQQIFAVALGIGSCSDPV